MYKHALFLYLAFYLHHRIRTGWFCILGALPICSVTFWNFLSVIFSINREKLSFLRYIINFGHVNMSEKHGKFSAGSQRNYQVSEVCLLKCRVPAWSLSELTFGAGLREVHCPWSSIPHFSLPLRLTSESSTLLKKSSKKVRVSLGVILRTRCK